MSRKYEPSPVNTAAFIRFMIPGERYDFAGSVVENGPNSSDVFVTLQVLAFCDFSPEPLCSGS